MRRAVDEPLASRAGASGLPSRVAPPVPGGAEVMCCSERASWVRPDLLREEIDGMMFSSHNS